MSRFVELDRASTRAWLRVLLVRLLVLATFVPVIPFVPDLSTGEQHRLYLLIGLVAIPYNAALVLFVRRRRRLHPAMTFLDVTLTAIAVWQAPNAAAAASAMALSHLALGMALFGRAWAVAALAYGTAAMAAATSATSATSDTNAGLLGFGAAGIVLIATIAFLQSRERESSVRFTSLVDSVDAIVWEYDLVERRRTFINRRAGEILGPLATNGLGDWTDYVHPDDRAAMERHMQRALERTEDTAEYRLHTADGTTMWVRSTISPAVDPHGNVTMLRGVAVDVTAEQTTAIALRQYADIVDNMQLSLLVWELVDLDDPTSLTMRAINPAGVALFRTPADEVVGRRVTEVFGDNPATHTYCDQLATAIVRNERSNVDHGPYELPNGVAGIISLVLAPLPGNAVAVICQDVSERWQAQHELRHQALHDSLTGLPNRALLQDRLTTALSAARRNPSEVALLLMDLDQFKEINDTLGHLTGDRLLSQVGARLADLLRDCDTVARLGGDEFAVLLTVDADRAGAERVAQRIVETLDEPFELDGLQVQTAVSIGIALSPGHGVEPETVVQRADIAMYKAKRGGLGFAFYSPQDDHTSVRRLSLVGELRRAIDAGELELHFQPKIALHGGDVVGVEALVRWRHPAHGLLAPGEFIPLAEVSGLIQPLTRWVVATSLAQAARWERTGRTFPVSVNVSARNLYEPGLVRGIADELAANGIAADRLVLELTESQLVEDPSQVMTVLSLVSGMGMGLAIDDFGTGWSSLSNLTRLPIQEVKIDRSFVIGMLRERDDEVIVRSIVDLGHNLGLLVVAEGVESCDMLDKLRTLGCDQAQGYFICPPVPAPELDEWLIEYEGAAAVRLTTS